MGLNVPGNVHFGYSSNKRAHSLRFTSNMSSISMRLERRMNPTGVVGSGVIFAEVSSQVLPWYRKTYVVIKDPNVTLRPFALFPFGAILFDFWRHKDSLKIEQFARQ